MAKLITLLQVGRRKLLHRIVVAPMTRYRADDENVQLAYVKEYYSQRTCVPGTLVVTEATYISPRSIGAHSTPGVWSEAQISARKEVTRAVHGHGSFIFCQLWALGQEADAELLKKKGGKFGSSSAVPINDQSPVPEPLTEEEIQLFINDFVQAAKHAIDAGFDGVEIHGANGYLVDQFIQDTCNKRTEMVGDGECLFLHTLDPASQSRLLLFSCHLSGILFLQCCISACALLFD
jgi:NADPH2 dehydrogenase